MSREVRVGLMFLLSVSILGMSLYFLGNFQEMVGYKIRFKKVNGLAVDSPVHYNGVPIGRVTKIVLEEEVQPGQDVPIIVNIAVHRSVRNHIRASTDADIKSVGVLGDKSILLITRDYGAPILAEGDFINTAATALDVDKLLEQGTDLVTDVGEITKDLKKILNQMANEDGLLQRVISDKELVANLQKAVSGVLGYLENDENMMALMLKDKEFADKVKGDLESVMDDVTTITARYREANGLVPALMTDEEYKRTVQEKLLEVLNESSSYVKTLKDGRGLVHKMTQDEVYAERLTQNLDKASFHLASILEKIDRGEGTAALLVNDPSLYAGLYEVVYGLQHSGISKWYIQRKQKKGARMIDEKQKNKETP